MSCLSHSLLCLALALLRLRSLCACSRSVRSLEVFLFLSRSAMLLVAPAACLLHVHSKKIVSHSLCLALVLRLHSLCALAQDYSLSLATPLRWVALECFRHVRLKITLSIRRASRLLCACARFARSLIMRSLSHSLFCLALALLRLCSLCACSRSVRSLKVFLFLSRFALGCARVFVACSL